MRRPQNPMRRSWLDDTGGGWIAHRLQLVMSPPWRLAPMPLRRVLERLEIEHMRHAGKENGHLVVSYDQFVKFGVSRKAIRGALELGERLGLLEVRQSNNWIGDIRQPNEYRLTYVPEKDRKAPTDEWNGLTEDQVKVIVGGKHSKTGSQFPFRPSTSALSDQNQQATSALSDQMPVPKRELSIISGRKAAADTGLSEQARRERQHTTSAVPAPSPTYPPSTSGPVPISNVLANMLAAANANPAKPIELSDGERSILKWLIGHGAASHRLTQQAFSGRIKGDEIKAITDALASMSLIRVDVEGRGRTYAVLEAGRDPALIEDTAQIDLEAWLAGAEH